MLLMGRWVFVLLILCLVQSTGLCAIEDDTLAAAKALVKAGNRAAAVELLQNAIATRTDEASEWLRGYALEWRDDKAGAVLQFHRMVDRFPQSNHRPNALLAAGYLQDGMRQDGKADWERIVQEHPHTREAAEALHCLGHLALRNHDPESAIRIFKQSAETPEAEPECAADSRAEAGYACISRYWKTRDRDFLNDAQEIFRPAAASADTPLLSVRAHLGMGEVLLIMGDGAGAARQYQAALAAKPQHPYLLGIAQFGLASALYTKHDYVPAVAAFTEFLSIRRGATLVEKDHAWKQTRPGFIPTTVFGPATGNGLTRADLVPTAAYWKAASLVELKRYQEASAIIDELKPFAGSGITKRVENLRKICAHMLGEDK